MAAYPLTTSKLRLHAYRGVRQYVAQRDFRDSVGFATLDFARLTLRCYSSQGAPFVVEVPVGMPRLSPKTTNLVGYLYGDVDDAEKGCDFGGTAFFVSVPSKIPGRAYFYAVSNWHVAVRGGASKLKVNTKDGDTDIFDFGPEDWEFDPRYDIAAVFVPLSFERHQFSVIPAPDGFVKRDDIDRV